MDRLDAGDSHGGLYDDVAGCQKVQVTGSINCNLELDNLQLTIRSRTHPVAARVGRAAAARRSPGRPGSPLAAGAASQGPMALTGWPRAARPSARRLGEARLQLQRVGQAVRHGRLGALPGGGASAAPRPPRPRSCRSPSTSVSSCRLVCTCVSAPGVPQTRSSRRRANTITGFIVWRTRLPGSSRSTWSSSRCQ